MDCGQVEELLIDYLQDLIELEQSKLIQAHLNVCAVCSNKFEEYKSIKIVFQSEDLPKLSQNVIDNITTNAQQYSYKQKPPFWKKWFYSPILIPALSATIAVMVWIDYTDTDKTSLEKIPVHSRAIMAKKLPQPKLNSGSEPAVQYKEHESSDRILLDITENIPKTKENLVGRDIKEKRSRSAIVSDNIEFRNDNIISYSNKIAGESRAQKPERENQFAFNSKESQNLISDHKQSKDVHQIAKGKVSPGISSEKFDEVGTVNEKDLDNENYKYGSTGKLIIENENIKDKNSPSNETVTNTTLIDKENQKSFEDARLIKVESPEVVLDKKYLAELNNAINLQKSGDCESSTIINENLLKKNPTPSNRIKIQSYLSLAECYEQQKKYAKAIENYRLLQQVAPSQTNFSIKKINELNFKIQNIDESDSKLEPGK